MMAQLPQELFAKFNANPPAEVAAIQHVQAASQALPQDYIAHLQVANGGEGFVGDAYLVLWPVEQLIELNEAYKVGEFAPGLFLFGSDGGGEAFAFDLRAKGSRPIVSVPFVSMALTEARPIGSDFNEFLRNLSRS